MNILPGIILFLHDLFSAIWIGGLFFLVVIQLPILKKQKDKKSGLNAFSLELQKRLQIYVIISIVGLFITGLLLSKLNGTGGFLKFGTEYQILLSVKHILIFMMIGMAVWRSIMFMKLEKTKFENPKMKMKEMKKTMLPLLINFILGIVVLLFTGLLSVAVN